MAKPWKDLVAPLRANPKHWANIEAGVQEARRHLVVDKIDDPACWLKQIGAGRAAKSEIRKSRERLRVHPPQGSESKT